MMVSSIRACLSVSTAANEPGAVVERHHPHARREPGGDGLELGLDAVDDVDRAHPIARHHDTTDRFVGPFDEGTGPEGVADLHLGHLPDKDGDSVLRANLLDVAAFSMSPRPRITDQVPLASTTLPRHCGYFASPRPRPPRAGCGRRAGGADPHQSDTADRPPTLATSATPGTALS